MAEKLAKAQTDLKKAKSKNKKEGEKHSGGIQTLEAAKDALSDTLDRTKVEVQF